MMAGAGVDVLHGWGKLVDEHTVQITSTDNGDVKEYTADKIAICTGGWPFKPECPGSDLEGVITSNEAFYLEELPKRVVVVGGGYIAVEFAGIFQGFGSDVTLMYRGETFLRGFDMDLRTHLKEEVSDYS
jgi:glutathione reductase (NADPH)